MDTILLTNICKALSSPIRLEIFQKLKDGEMCACHLLEHFEITQPTLSHHMHVLCDCQLIWDRKEGKWQHYSLNCETLTQFKEFRDTLGQFGSFFVSLGLTADCTGEKSCDCVETGGTTDE